jgi:hypothetical protein
MNDFQVEMLTIALVALLLILAVIVRCRVGPKGQGTGPATRGLAKDAFPGIDPAEFASVTEQQAVLDQLATLPQIRRLPDGTLVDWTTATWIGPCTCSQGKTTPHLQLARLPKHGLGMISRAGLSHYLAYQQAVARQLRGNGGGQ